MSLRQGCWAVVFGACVLAGPAVGPMAIHAQDDAQDIQDDRATAFRAVEGAPEEQVPGGPLLLGAYAIVWVALLLFVLRLAYLYAKTRRDLDGLERRLGGGPGAPPE
jgi:hypothetical protein